MTDTPPQGQTSAPAIRGPREWHRVLALGLFLLSTSVVGPVSLVAVPFLLMVLGLPVRRPGALLLALVAVVYVLARPGTEGSWYLERAWGLMVGGGFVGLTLAWPRARFIHRALGAVAGAAAVSGVSLWVRPGAWSTVDWGIRDRLAEGVSQAVFLVRQFQGDQGLPEGLEASVMQTAEVQAHLFPAFLALSSLAGLAIAWWLYARVAVGRTGALGSLREFGFQDQLIWVFIAGLFVLVLAANGGWDRVGHNTVFLMGALYVLRGAGVMLFLNGGIGVLGAMFLALAMLLIAPVLLAGAMLIGLGDTWLDVRTRVRALTS